MSPSFSELRNKGNNGNENQKVIPKASLVSQLKTSAAKIADRLSKDADFVEDVSLALEGKVEAARGPYAVWKDLCRIIPEDERIGFPVPRSEDGNNPAIVKDGNKILLDYYNTIADDTELGSGFLKAIADIQAVKSGKADKVEYQGISSVTELTTLEANIRGRLNHVRQLVKQAAALDIQLRALREFKEVSVQEKDGEWKGGVRTTVPFLVRDSRTNDPDHLDEYMWCSVPTVLKFNAELARQYLEQGQATSEYLALKKTLRQKKEPGETESNIKNFQEYMGTAAEMYVFLKTTFDDNAKRAQFFKELNADANADAIDYCFGIVELLTQNVTSKPALKAKYADKHEPADGEEQQAKAS